MISIWHNDRFLDYPLKGAEALKDTTIHLTARVNTDILQEAYRLTNNIDKSWAENPNVTVINAKGGPLRSTSVGDVLRHNDKWYVVEMVGFREMTREEECQIVFHTV